MSVVGDDNRGKIAHNVTSSVWFEGAATSVGKQVCEFIAAGDEIANQMFVRQILHAGYLT